MDPNIPSKVWLTGAELDALCPEGNFYYSSGLVEYYQDAPYVIAIYTGGPKGYEWQICDESSDSPDDYVAEGAEVMAIWAKHAAMKALRNLKS